MMKKVINLWAAVALVATVGMAITVLVLWLRGFSSRPVPSNLEASIAMKLYDSSIPKKYEKMANPISGDRLDIIDAGGHYEEHCAVCHGDDGGGHPKFHGLLYPRPTDLRAEDTQGMSEGELYWVIKNGVRWSGMPAFGKPGDQDEHAWKIVAYVRHLPKLTAVEKQQVLEIAEGRMNHQEPPHDHDH